MPVSTPNETSLQSLFDLFFAYAPNRALASGIQLGVFDALAAAPLTVDETAARIGASPRGTRMLLDVLAALGLLDKQGDHYALTPVSRRHLVRESPHYVGALLEGDGMWEAWGKLTDAIRTGQPVHRVESEERATQFFPVLIRSLHEIARVTAQRAAEVLSEGRSGLRVLDVACGSGVWSIAVAERDPKARVTAQDFPRVLDTTRQYVQRHGLAERYDYLPGDLKQVDLGADRWDVAILGNIVHSEGEASSRDLFRRLHGAMRPGGQVAIIDMVPSDDRSGPPFPLVFALNMLLNTSQGDTYTLAEYREWLTEAGFQRVETADIGHHSPMIVATR